MKKLEEYQKLADSVCGHFGVIPVKVKINFRLKTTYGIYRNSVIELRSISDETNETLIHELAHHLRSERFRKRVPGYFLTMMAHKMQLSSIDASGQKWYSATGPLEKVTFYRDGPHSKIFKKCYREISNYTKQRIQ